MSGQTPCSPDVQAICPDPACKFRCRHDEAPQIDSLAASISETANGLENIWADKEVAG